jgi:hypothetical protein
MKFKFIYFVKVGCLILLLPLNSWGKIEVELPAPGPGNEKLVKLENPMTVAYLKKNLRKSSPRLVLTPAIEANLKNKIKTDPVVRNVYQAIQLNAKEIQKQALLERKMVGRRLLGTSREMLYRMNMLGIVYRLDKEPDVLKRIEEEVAAVCNFPDWNPSHYLDVAEMSMAVALAIDWAGSDLPPATVELAKSSLIQKGINPSFTDKEPSWVNGTNNWNQVCHGGMIAAAIIIAENDPQLAAKTISRALEGMPHALKEYGPDGVYPEGSTYWSYGTSFSVLTSSMLESAFGTDFGLANYPAFQKSAAFMTLSMAPSGWYYNYADCGDKRSENGNFTLAWFAAKTGNKIYFEKERFLKDPTKMGELERWAGAGLVWISQFKDKQEKKLPLAWKGEGSNPIVIFRDQENDPRQFYFGGKGGRATVSHGNMDAGSFVFELDGVRWVIDPGNQNYNELEKTGFKLWESCQDCERWTLLTKNNFGHSTLSVNNGLHMASGFAPIVDFKNGAQPEATIDMSKVLGNTIERASRRFVKEKGPSMVIEDKFKLNAATQQITWQLMTTAEVEMVKGGALLKQDGKILKLENLSHPELGISVIALNPTPHQLDRQIENLKRIEIRLPAYLFPKEEGEVRVRLAAAK